MLEYPSGLALQVVEVRLLIDIVSVGQLIGKPERLVRSSVGAS